MLNLLNKRFLDKNIDKTIKINNRIIKINSHNSINSSSEMNDNFKESHLNTSSKNQSIIDKNVILSSSFVSNKTKEEQEFFSKRQPALYLSFQQKQTSKLTNLKKSSLVLNNLKTNDNYLLNENTNLKKYYTSYSKLSEVKLLTIGIASPLRILQWAEKTLPNGKIYGEVLNANTLHHKTFKPQKGGLFCERIFGPLKDFECACGKTDKLVKKIQTDSKLLNLAKKNELDKNKDDNSKLSTLTLNLKQVSSNSDLTKDNLLNKDMENLQNSDFGSITEKENSLSIKREIEQNLQITRKFCPDCDVEYTWSVIRRYQLGYIKLSSPITHIWFLKGTPSYLSLLLDMKKRYLQFVTYCSEILTIEKSCVPFYSNKDSYLANGNKPSFSNVNKNDFVSQIDPKGRSEVDQKGNVTEILKSALLPIKNQTGLNENVAFSEQLEIQSNSDSNKQNHYNKNKVQNKRSKIKCLPKKEWRSNEKNGSAKQGTKAKSVAAAVADQHTLDINHKQSVFSNKIQKINRKDCVVLSTLLLSIYYKYPSNLIKGNKKNLLLNMNVTDSINSLVESSYNEIPNFKKFVKKLPIDLYILSSLEYMLHKSCINLSIKNTWEQIYKKSFFKAINKSKILFRKFKNLNQKDLSLMAKNELKETSIFDIDNTSKKEKAAQFNLQLKESKVSFFRTNIVNYLQYHLDKLNKNESVSTKQITKNLINLISKNQMILKNLKNKYSNHVLKSLEKVRYPVFSVKNTTVFFEKNSFFENQKRISLEISNYLLNNIDNFEKTLVELLLNSFLLDEFLNSNMGKKSLYSDSYSYSYFYSTTTLNTFEKDHKNNSLTFTNQTNKKIRSILNILKTFLNLKKTSSFQQVSENEILDFVSNVKLNSFNFSKVLNNEDKDSNLIMSTQHNLHSIVSHKLVNTDIKKNFNNVYTLSHRERWDMDKDWYIFSLFTFGITEYTDYPIYNYKHRLLSLTSLQDYNYSHNNFSNNTITNEQSNNGKNMNSSVSVINNNSNNFSPVSASFINSNSFYSGAGIVQQLLNEFNFNEIQKLDKQNRLLLYQLNKSILKLKKYAQIFVYDKSTQVKLKELCKKRDLLIRRTKLVRKIFRKNTNPASMILTVVPVLPPDLRPIVKMGNQIAASDLNRLYQRVIYRNDRLKKFLKDPATSQSYEMKYAQRLLQEAVDNLMQNGKSGQNSEKDARGRILKSLSDILKGKQGRFRQFLLGKRVDYSGRSVIVVGPKLKLHECGLPLEMAKELYLPFLLKSILNKNYAKTVVGAKTLIQNNPSLANELLHEIMQITPVLLNRAPTLHRLGIQAFIPKLIQGRAILLHPLVCSAFNADFDGDQMAVHVPITIEARAEAWKMMLSRNNLLAPATGEPLAIPSQDMVLGCYYLTTILNTNKSKFLRGSGMYFNHLYDVIKLCLPGEQQFINIHSLVWVKWNKWTSLDSNLLNSLDNNIVINRSMDFIQNGNDDENPFEIRVLPSGQWQEITSNYQKMYDSNHNLMNLYMCTTPGRILFNLILQQSL